MIRILFLCLTVSLAGCAPRGNLTVMPEADQIGQKREVFVGTSRGIDQTTGFYSRARDETVRFARFDVSIPPYRDVGVISWPSRSDPADPHHHFLTTGADQFATDREFRAALATALRRDPRGRREAVVYMHGFNNNFAEGLYRVAQLSHDLEIPGVAVHYAWPSAANPLGYVYDRDSALFARDGLEMLLAEVAAAGADRILVVAHSMGSTLAMEALRQTAIRGNTDVLRRISGVILISPDIDVDVFRSQARAIGPLPQPFIVMTSQRDRTLAVSARIAREQNRLGNLRDLDRLADLQVTLLEVGQFGDGSEHFAAATSPALIRLLATMGEIDAAFGADRIGRTGFLPGAVLTVQSATRIILSPVATLAEELSR